MLFNQTFNTYIHMLATFIFNALKCITKINKHNQIWSIENDFILLIKDEI